MIPTSIEGYYRPQSIAEAVAHLSDDALNDPQIIAGNQSMMQAMKARIFRPDVLIDVADISELRGITTTDAGTRIGAMTRYKEIAEASLPSAYRALSDAAAKVGDRQVRNRGTIGGSLCWNYLTACMPPANIAVDSSVELQNAGGTRTLSAEEFLCGPLETEREDNELMTAIMLPTAPAHTGSAYQKWGLVTNALPVVSIGISVTLDGDTISSARLVLGSLSDGPARMTKAEAALIGQSTDFTAAIDAAANAADFEAEDSADAEYKRALLHKIGLDAIGRAVARAKGENI